MWVWLVGVVSHNVLNWQKREVEYDKYQLDKLTSAKSEFRILLKESKLITYKSHDLVRESDRHYNDIIDMLKVRGCCVRGGGGLHDSPAIAERQAVSGVGLCGRRTRRHASRLLRRNSSQGAPSTPHCNIPRRKKTSCNTLTCINTTCQLQYYFSWRMWVCG